MKVDVIATYYRQAHMMPFFFWGIDQNRDDINRVIIVNDEPWGGELPFESPLGLDISYLDHPHEGYGVSRSMNQGIAAATTPYCFLMSVDLVMPLGTVKKAIARASESHYVFGAVDTIDATTTLEDLPNPKVTLEDFIDRTNKWALCVKSGESYACARNGHALVSKVMHDKVGGFNEEFVKAGYGYEDWEYAVRWTMAGGEIVRSTGRMWHFSQPSERKLATNGASVLYAKTLLKKYEGRLHLFTSKASPGLIGFANVGHTDFVTGLMLDCEKLDWLLPGEASLIYLPNARSYSVAYLQLALSKVGKTGLVTIEQPFDDFAVDSLGDIDVTYTDKHVEIRHV